MNSLLQRAEIEAIYGVHHSTSIKHSPSAEVHDEKADKIVAEVLKRLGSEHVLVVHSKDGLDELSLASTSYIAELKDGEVREYEVSPEELGIQSRSLIGLTVDDATASLKLIRDALGKRETEAGEKAADIIILNAGAALYAADHASSLREGVELASDALYSGLAREKLNELIAFTEVFREEAAQ